ncbi:alpha/beta hydrolase [Actinoplanes sp. NBRC 101535]|nr:alpha/beta hydrolase [Actinoplanes sp. NBRC 101535]
MERPRQEVPVSRRRVGGRDVKTRDDRILAVNATGAENGWPVFLFHGTPGSRTGPLPRASVLYRRGILLISYDRPGYGRSTPQPGRRVADAAADVADIARDLGLDRFSVVGRSGGGPHALACAALLPDMVHRAATLVGMAPHAPDLDFGAGMTDDNVAAFIPAADPDNSGISERLRWRANRTAADPNSLLDQLLTEMAPADRRVVQEAAIQRLLVDSYDEAVSQGPHGWIDDVLAMRRDWGFAVGDIRVPVYIWHGEQDNFAPPAHARWLARNIPGAVLELQNGRGHFAAMGVLPSVLTWLAGVDDRPHQEIPGEELSAAV